jgi:hypothetical protein
MPRVAMNLVRVVVDHFKAHGNNRLYRKLRNTQSQPTTRIIAGMIRLSMRLI